jgi:hypothetical protein
MRLIEAMSPSTAVSGFDHPIEGLLGISSASMSSMTEPPYAYAFRGLLLERPMLAILAALDFWHSLFIAISFGLL